MSHEYETFGEVSCPTEQGVRSTSRPLGLLRLARRKTSIMVMGVALLAAATTVCLIVLPTRSHVAPLPHKSIEACSVFCEGPILETVQVCVPAYSCARERVGGGGARALARKLEREREREGGMGNPLGFLAHVPPHACCVLCAEICVLCRHCLPSRAPLCAIVQSMNLFADSKHFVDMPLMADPAHVLAEFRRVPQPYVRTDVMSFLHTYFGEPGSDMEDWVPQDHMSEPPVLARIANATLRQWASDVNALWPILGRRVKDDVVNSPQRHSLLPLRHPVIVPGGRFRETYYWDSYWILRGLLTCGMRTTALGMIRNFLDLVATFGFIPNGARVYYLDRSQPPVLALMVDAYATATGDASVVAEALPSMDQEYSFWMDGIHAVRITDGAGRTHVLNRYCANTTRPRPESYREDVNLTSGLSSDAAGALYQNVASAAESGWDFSSRWFADLQHLRSAVTTAVVPVDLNAFLYRMEVLLAGFHRTHGDAAASARYEQAAQVRTEAMEAFMWNSTRGMWFDYRIDTHAQSADVTAANYVPLWAGCGRLDANPGRAGAVLRSLRDSGLVRAGGLLTSLRETGEQWDFPNAWAPLQHMLVEGLHSVGTAEAQSMSVRALPRAAAAAGRTAQSPCSPSPPCADVARACLAGEQPAGVATLQLHVREVQRDRGGQGWRRRRVCAAEGVRLDQRRGAGAAGAIRADAVGGCGPGAAHGRPIPRPSACESRVPSAAAKPSTYAHQMYPACSKLRHM